MHTVIGTVFNHTNDIVTLAVDNTIGNVDSHISNRNNTLHNNYALSVTIRKDNGYGVCLDRWQGASVVHTSKWLLL